jgi:hypothetical protein
MHKMTWLILTATALMSVSLIQPQVRAAELEGALQYPPSSVGEDVQPPPPARMLPQPVSPWRVELGISGSSTPPSAAILYPFPTPLGGT